MATALLLDAGSPPLAVGGASEGLASAPPSDAWAPEREHATSVSSKDDHTPERTRGSENLTPPS